MEEIIDKESRAKLMYDELRKNIGNNVLFIYWDRGFKNRLVERLIDVEDFGYITIESYSIPSVGNNIAIDSIFTEDGKTLLYSNPYVKGGYVTKSYDDMFEKKREMFGDRIADDFIKKINEINARESSNMKELDRKTIIAKPRLISVGTKLVKEELVDEWKKYSDLHTDNDYDAAIIRGAIIVMRLISQGIEFSDALKMVCAKYGLTGNQCEYVSMVVSHFTKENDEITHKK